MINSLGEGLTLLMIVIGLGAPLLLLLVKGKGQREKRKIFHNIPNPDKPEAKSISRKARKGRQENPKPRLVFGFKP